MSRMSKSCLKDIVKREKSAMISKRVSFDMHEYSESEEESKIVSNR